MLEGEGDSYAWGQMRETSGWLLAPVTMGGGQRPKALTLSSPIQFTSVSPAPGTVPGIQYALKYVLNTCLVTRVGAEKGVVSVDLYSWRWSWEGLARQREHVLSVEECRDKGWRDSGRESRWATGCGKP